MPMLSKEEVFSLWKKHGKTFVIPFGEYQKKELVDICADDVEIKKIPTPPSGKKIIDTEVTFKISKE